MLQASDPSIFDVDGTADIILTPGQVVADAVTIPNAALRFKPTRDQMMARHKANHIQVVYAPSAKQASRACRIKAAMLAELGLEVHLCGNVALE